MPNAEPLKLIEKKKSSSCKDLSCIDYIKTRVTDELVVALCGAIGSGASVVGEKIREILKGRSYSVRYVKLSDIILKYSDDQDLQGPIDSLGVYQRYNVLQNAGNELRRNYSCDILAQLAIYNITLDRAAYDEEYGNGPEVEVHQPRRCATIIDSLKHPDEWKLLKTVYGKMFYLFGVLCPEDVRKNRLIDYKSIEGTDAGVLIKRDKQESFNSGQQFIKTIQHADFFIRNIKNTPGKLDAPLERYINLILSDNKYSPTVHEYAMYVAQAAAHRSSCLSRQVGAAIVSREGEVIATGRNDAPKFGGGLYDGGEADDCSCIRAEGCLSDKYKEIIAKEILGVLKEGLGEDVDTTMLKEIVGKIKKSTKLKDIIEFSRAVHAEMDAILSVARRGVSGLHEATLYCTTFPCHHCARHIVASGIARVFYIEPYEKSLAYRLHNDAIVLDSDNTEVEGRKVKFLPFEGVAPSQYMNMFKDREKKKEGIGIKVDTTSSKPISEQLMDSFAEYEDKVVTKLKETGLLDRRK